MARDQRGDCGGTGGGPRSLAWIWQIDRRSGLAAREFLAAPTFSGWLAGADALVAVLAAVVGVVVASGGDSPRRLRRPRLRAS